MTIISSNTENGSGDAFDFSSARQVLVVETGVYLVSDVNYAVLGPTSYISDAVFNHGYIVGNSGVRLADAYETVVNYADGQISAYSNYAVFESGSSALVTNYGLITGPYGIGEPSADAVVENFGTVDGSYTGVNLAGIGDLVVNSGQIRSAGTAIEVQAGASLSLSNSGIVDGSSQAINTRLTSGACSVLNTGTIDGAIAFGDGAASVVNYSTIRGDLTFGSGSDTFKNSGLLDGDLTFGGGAYSVTNRGTITGDVNLGDGGGTFYGRKGSIDGTIMGGAGADTILAGDDGETMAGGKGHDVLYGGAGADTFAFASGAGSDTDVVHGFNVADDTIQLAHSAYSHLAAGQTPTFAVGTAATSPTDYLFYNSGTGGLYYDSNGSAANGAYLIATLDKGLNLVANNFSVV